MRTKSERRPLLASPALVVVIALMSSGIHSQEMASTSPASATPPSPAPPKQILQPPRRLPEDLAAFFVGEWSGAGEFASGRKIEADVSFTPDLDGQWLAYRHIDRAPNKYKAAGMWGFERSSNSFVMTVNDSFGGARTFTSTGWQDGRIVFNRGVLSAGAKLERFTFLRVAADGFKMAYETSDDGDAWKMIDHVVFTKKH